MKFNKVNPFYTQRGRLTPDDIARERMRQAEVSGRSRVREKMTAKSRQHGERGASRPRSAPEERG